MVVRRIVAEIGISDFDPFASMPINEAESTLVSVFCQLLLENSEWLIAAARKRKNSRC